MGSRPWLPSYRPFGTEQLFGATELTSLVQSNFPIAPRSLPMSTLANLQFHIVFSTKYRRPTIDSAWRDELYGYIGGIIRESHGTLVKMGGVADHCHLLVKLHPTMSISDLVRLIKANSSRWVNEREDVRTRFQWQPGYAVFSVSESQAPAVKQYIADQEKHHRIKSFSDELIALLERHRVEYDKRYVFETEGSV